MRDVDKLMKDRSELTSLLVVIEARMSGMEHPGNVLDPDLWHILSLQLKQASIIASGMSQNCRNKP